MAARQARVSSAGTAHTSPLAVEMLVPVGTTGYAPSDRSVPAEPISPASTTDADPDRRDRAGPDAGSTHSTPTSAMKLSWHRMPAAVLKPQPELLGVPPLTA